MHRAPIFWDIEGDFPLKIWIQPICCAAHEMTESTVKPHSTCQRFYICWIIKVDSSVFGIVPAFYVVRIKTEKDPMIHGHDMQKQHELAQQKTLKSMPHSS